MNYTQIRRRLLKVFIGFLTVSALVGIFSVLSQAFGEVQLKVLVTSLAISAGSICAMSCAGFLERKGAKWIGVAGIVAAVFGAVMVIAAMWGEINERFYRRCTITVVLIAIAFAYACLVHLPKLAAGYRWVQAVSSVLIGLLTLQIIVAVWKGISDEGYYRAMAALAILAVLSTLVVPLCAKLGAAAREAPQPPGPSLSPAGAGPDRLILRRVSGAVFADDAGRTYQVTEIQPAATPLGDAPGLGAG